MTINDWLSKLVQFEDVAAGIPGLLISAATKVAFSSAQSVVDQVVTILSPGKAQNEEAFNTGAIQFAVTQVAPAMEKQTLRIPKTPQTYVILPGGDPTQPILPGDGAAPQPQSDKFEDRVKGKSVQQASSGALSLPGDSSAFDDMNYIIVDTLVSTQKRSHACPLSLSATAKRLDVRATRSGSLESLMRADT